MSFSRQVGTQALLAVVAMATLHSQSPQARQLTAEDYAQAEKFMAYNVNPLVDHTVNAVTWMPDERFWFRDATAEGTTFVVVDPAKGTKAPAFDHARLASALVAAGVKVDGRPAIDAHHLPVTDFSFEKEQTLQVTTRSGRYRCDLSDAGKCAAMDEAGGAPPRARGRAMPDVSPDKKKAAFLRDWNLWVRDVATGKELRLDLTPTAFDRLLASGVPMHLDISVPVKGRYVLRLAVQDLNANKMGVVELPVERIQRAASGSSASAQPSR